MFVLWISSLCGWSNPSRIPVEEYHVTRENYWTIFFSFFFQIDSLLPDATQAPGELVVRVIVRISIDRCGLIARALLQI
jgi:hypothetical protein